MDQGQALLYPVAWLDDKDQAVLCRNNVSDYRVIEREVEYDPMSLLQINESSSTHIPQGNLVPQAPLRLTIADKFISYEPFMRLNRLFSCEASAPIVVQNRDSLFRSVRDDISKWKLSLWSRVRHPQELIRISPQFKLWDRFDYEYIPSSTFRQQEWLLCAETLRNFDPIQFSYIDKLVVNMHHNEQFRLDEFKGVIIGSLYRSRVNLYHRFIDQHETDLQNGNNIEGIINKIGDDLSQYIRVYENQAALIDDPLNTLVLWLLLPHVGGNPFKSVSLEYCFFVLSIMLTQHRFPKDDEFKIRQIHANPFNRKPYQDPTYGIPPTSNDYITNKII